LPVTFDPTTHACKGEFMSISWNDDFDNVMRDASGSGRPILLDFSAAPM
jgi:hypothetical protein